MVNNERIPVRIKERIKGMSKKRVEYEILLLFITIPLSLFNRGAPIGQSPDQPCQVYVTFIILQFIGNKSLIPVNEPRKSAEWELIGK